jgi:hypothetical protein
MGNFSDPCGGQSKKGSESVADDHPGIHVAGNGIGYLKIKPDRCDLLKIMGIGEECPGRFKGYRQ